MALLDPGAGEYAGHCFGPAENLGKELMHGRRDIRLLKHMWGNRRGERKQTGQFILAGQRKWSSDGS
ncbi:hypothetical protein GCM10017653_39920 [Ancylobacter defluvii]|uniref:Uncharacterized protein n=1 Tax=Ancylobacter defluvii TaxID=1282440 RepID=A0A9W6JZC1_9HYPH|nr:hypothetical protein GCM10017653_39920 [Ancylobacter defluvii]